MNTTKRTKGLVYATIFCISLFFIGCDATTTTTLTNNKANNDNKTTETTNTENSDKTNKADETSQSVELDTKEPEKYSAKVNLKISALSKDSKMAVPTLEATVARDGANKRMEINAPNGQKFVYLEIGKKNLLVLPDKKQYAELNKESVGMNVRGLMTPEQIVQRAKNIKGLKKVGEEKYDGRDAVKYEYSAKTETNTKAGEVNTKSFVFVDKETGLPLKTEITSASDDANIKGYKGVKIVTEMSDIKTEVSKDMFKEPEGFEKIEEEQIRSQINLVFNVVGQFLKQMMENANSK